MTDETKYCSNCKRQIAVANFIMHEMHCKRNIVLCEKCQEPVPRSEMDSHIEEEHALLPCPLCQNEFEISKLDEHKVVCPKRNAHCDYCQLDMPECDLADHKDYCGTRTEQCPLCSQFIMLKDMDQHETSLCTFPPPKQSSQETSNLGPSRTTSRPNNLPEPVSLADLNPEPMSSFTMNELSRLLNESSIAPSNLSSLSQNNGYQPNASSSRGRPIAGNTNSSERTRRSRIGPRPPLHVSRNISKTKRTNETVNQRNKNINVPQANDNQASDADLDEMLARHLAHDLGSEFYGSHNNDNTFRPDEMDAMGSHRNRNSPSPDVEEICLPCEFCGDLFPLKYLVQHQGTCQSFEPQPDEEERSQAINITPSSFYTESIPNNHSPRRTVSSNLPSRPHIVDNLSGEANLEWFPLPSERVDSDEETMLPCEFCEQLFPDDILVQHQAVCDRDYSSSMSYPSPDAAVTPSPGINTRARGNQRLQRNDVPRQVKSNVAAASNHVTSSRGRRPRRQGDPAFNFRQHSPDDSRPFGAANGQKLRKPSGNRKKPTKEPWTRTEKGPSQGVRPRVEGSGASYLSSRPTIKKTANSPNQTGAATAADGGGGVGGQYLEPNSKRAGSAARVHRTLEQLLQDPTCSTHDLLAAIDKDEKSNRNQRTKDATHSLPVNDAGELSLSNAVNDTKPRSRRGRRSPSDGDGNSRYDPSFSRPPPRVNSKPRPIQPRAAEFAGASNIRVNKSPNIVSELAAYRGTEGTRNPTTTPLSGSRKRTTSRPRKATQGEP